MSAELVADASRPLPNPKQERFARLVVEGLLDSEVPSWARELAGSDGDPQPRGSLRWSYAIAYEQANLNAADVGAQRLMRLEHVQRRIRALRSGEAKRESLLARKWVSMLPRAQRTIELAMEGRATGVQLRAAQLVVEQAVGPAALRFRVDAPAGSGGAGGFGVAVEVWGVGSIPPRQRPPVPGNRILGNGHHHPNGEGNGNGKPGRNGHHGP